MKVRTFGRIASVAAAVTLVAAATACGSSNDNPNPAASGALATVQVMMFPGQLYRLPVIVGDQQGMFAKHGLKISIIAQPNNLQGAQAMVATNSQIGQLSTATLAQGVEAGSPVSFFCGGVKYLQTSLIAKNGSSINAGSGLDVIQQLSGKNVGVQTPVGSGLQLLFAAALDAAGVKNVTYVNVGGGNDITLAALNKGSVDVAQVNPPATQAIQVSNQAKVLTYLPAAGGPDAYKLYGSAWTGQTSWLKDHPDQAKAFCDTMTEAVAWINNPANADAAAKALAADNSLDPAIAAQAVKTAFADHSTDLPKDTLMRTFQFYKQIGITKTDLSAQYDKLVQQVG